MVPLYVLVYDCALHPKWKEYDLRIRIRKIYKNNKIRRKSNENCISISPGKQMQTQGKHFFLYYSYSVVFAILFFLYSSFVHCCVVSLQKVLSLLLLFFFLFVFHFTFFLFVFLYTFLSLTLFSFCFVCCFSLCMQINGMDIRSTSTNGASNDEAEDDSQWVWNGRTIILSAIKSEQESARACFFSLCG